MIIISPYSKQLISKKRNPKNYPYWKELTSAIKENEIIQIGVTGEEQIVKDFRKNLPLKQIEDLVRQCELWMSVDNFFPHLAHHIGKPGLVIFGVSYPNIYGYPENINILKDRKYLRKNQFDMYDSCLFNEDVFLKPNDIIVKIKTLLDKIREQIGK